MRQATTFAAFTAATLLATSALAAQKIGVVGAANPSVIVKSEDGATRNVKTGDAIYLNDTVTTGGKGSAQLMFQDKSALTISPDSEVMIDTFVYNPASKDGTMSMSSAKGALRFIGGALTKKKPVKIKTPVSTIGIRGGITDTFVDAGGQTDAIFVFGKELTMQGNDGGAPVSLTQFGQGLGVDTAGAPPAPLPPSVIATRVGNSPTTAAVNTAPATTGGNAIEQKMEQKGSAADRAAGGHSGAAAQNAGGGESGGNTNSNAPASKSSGGNSNGGGDGGNTGGGSGSNDGASNTNNAEGNAATASAAPAGDSGGGEGFSYNGNAQGSDTPAAAPLADAPAPVAIEVDTAAAGGSAQENLRENVREFIVGGGDADGDGQLDFEIANLETAPQGDEAPSLVDRFVDFIQGADPEAVDQVREQVGGELATDNDKPQEGRSCAAENGQDACTDNPDTPIAEGDGPDGELPLADGLDDTITETADDDGPNTEDNNTADGGGTTGGGTTGGGNPPAPNVNPVGTNFAFNIGENQFLSSASATAPNLLNGVTDADGDTVTINSITVGSNTYSSPTPDVSLGGAYFAVDVGHGTLYVYTDGRTNYNPYTGDDLLPGETDSDTLQISIDDGRGGSNNFNFTLDVIGSDYFGNTVAWDNNGPQHTPWNPGAGNGTPTTINGRGHYHMLDSGGSHTEKGRIILSKDSMYSDYNFMMTREFNGANTATPSPENYVIGSLIRNDSATDDMHAGWNPIISTNNLFETHTGEEAMDLDFAGVSLNTHHNAFNYYSLAWDGDQDSNTTNDRNYMNIYAGTSLIQANYEATGSLGNVSADYADMVNDTVALANTHSVNNMSGLQAVVNYSFLPEMHAWTASGGDLRFGRFNHNVWNASGANWLNDLNSSNYHVNADSNYGLLVDWQNNKYFTGYVDFTGDVSASGKPALITAFGNINPSVSASATDGVVGGNVFEGSFFDHQAKDTDMDGFIQPNEMQNKSGFAETHIDELFSNPDAAAGEDNTINAIVLQSGDGTVPGTQAAILDNKAQDLDINRNIDNNSYSYNGFTAGIAVDDASGEASRIKGAVVSDVDSIRNTTAGVSYTFVDTTTNIGASTTVNPGLGDGHGGDNAAIQKDMYGAANSVGDTVIIAPGSNSTAAVCSSCEFAHWGVWAASTATGAPSHTTGIVPYIAGEVTPVMADGTAVGQWSHDSDSDGIYDPLDGDGPGVLGNVNYVGDATANFAISNGASTELVNAVGSATAAVNLGTRQIAPNGVDIQFNNIGGDANRALGISNSSVVTIHQATNQFLNEAITHTYTDSAGVSSGASADGAMSGALFGPGAEELGGNFYLENSTASEGIKAGGVFLGKR